MFRIFLSIFLTFCWLSAAFAAGGDILRLEEIAQQESLSSTRLVLQCSRAPKYRVKTSGQRIDIFLSATEAASGLRLPEENERIVKVLLARGKDELMVSFLLRRSPVQILPALERSEGTVALDLFWGEGSARPAIAFRIAGMPGIQEGGVIAAPEVRSPYAGRWEAFFREYRMAPEIEVPLFFSILPRVRETSLIDTDFGRMLERIIEAGDWRDVQRTLRMLDPQAPGSREALIVEALQAEALVRSGAFTQGLAALEPLRSKDLPPVLRGRVGYLYSLALSASGDPQQGLYHLNELLPHLEAENPYRAHLLMLHAEINLAGKMPEEALSQLQQQGAWPQSWSHLRQLRIADALAATGHYPEALGLYRGLDTLPALLAQHPYSLYRCAQTHREAGDPEQAGFLFAELAKVIPPGSEQGLAQFASGEAYAEAGRINQAMAYWMQVQVENSATEGDFRARLEMLDYDVLRAEELPLRIAIDSYAEVAAQAPRRELREEAALKQALVLHLLKRNQESVRALLDFRRDFAAGTLQVHAEYLLRELVPLVIADLIEFGEDLEALVLVEQTRDLLLAGGMNLNFLLDVGAAAANIGLYDRACRVYLYILEGTGGHKEKERFYLPLTKLAFRGGDRMLVLEYASRYMREYPRGEAAEEIFFMLLRSLKEEGRLEDARVWLESENRLSSGEIDQVAAEIFWELGDWQAVADCFRSQADAPRRGLLLKAEALRKLARFEPALALFEQLAGEDGIGEQAIFRSAQIFLETSRRNEGLNLLRQLAEKKNDSLWRRLAEESLAAEALM